MRPLLRRLWHRWNILPTMVRPCEPCGSPCYYLEHLPHCRTLQAHNGRSPQLTLTHFEGDLITDAADMRRCMIHPLAIGQVEWAVASTLNGETTGNLLRHLGQAVRNWKTVDISPCAIDVTSTVTAPISASLSHPCPVRGDAIMHRRSATGWCPVEDVA